MSAAVLTRVGLGASAGTAARVAWRIARSLISLVLVLFVTASLTFVVMELAGGDPVSAVLGENAVIDEATRQAVIAQYGLDQPIWIRYLDYLSGLPFGDFGLSYVQRKPVSEVLAVGFAPTAQLALAAAVVAIVIALFVGLGTSRTRPVPRFIAQALELVLVSTPTFWLGIILLTIFGFGLRWFPIWGDDGWQSLVLPAFALGLPIAAMLAQVIREGADRAESEPFVLSARARGTSDTRVRYVHILRHAAGPALNVAGLVIGGLLGGAVLTESVFGRAGLGSIALQAIVRRDLPVVLAVVLVSATVYVIVSTITDLLQTLLDPRTAHAERRAV
ncbi:ABC transporter permease [Leucobacter musarum]|uniref:ABC transporter permease n=1 Tax=Leucobacter musarum TaxID=1930747 RepID=UPI0006A78DCC|nr:ABC transporter permease [Leucobacter musarum]